MLIRIGKIAERIINQIAFAGFIISCVAVLITTVIVSVGASSRYFFRIPIHGVSEITSILMLCASMFAIAFVQTRDGHVRVDLVTSHLPRRGRVICHNIFSPLVGMVWCAVGTWKGLQEMVSAYQKGLASEWLMYFPTWICYLVVVLGFGFLFLTLLVIFIRTIVSESSARRLEKLEHGEVSAVQATDRLSIGQGGTVGRAS